MCVFLHSTVCRPLLASMLARLSVSAPLPFLLPSLSRRLRAFVVVLIVSGGRRGLSAAVESLCAFFCWFAGSFRLTRLPRAGGLHSNGQRAPRRKQKQRGKKVYAHVCDEKEGERRDETKIGGVQRSRIARSGLDSPSLTCLRELPLSFCFSSECLLCCSRSAVEWAPQMQTPLLPPTHKTNGRNGNKKKRKTNGICSGPASRNILSLGGRRCSGRRARMAPKMCALPAIAYVCRKKS